MKISVICLFFGFASSTYFHPSINRSPPGSFINDYNNFFYWNQTSSNRRFDTKPCQRLENPLFFNENQIQFDRYNRLGYWTFCSRPQPYIYWSAYSQGPYQTQWNSNPHPSQWFLGPDYSSLSYDINYQRSDGQHHNNHLASHFLGRGKCHYFNGRRDVQMSCNLNVTGLRIIERPTWHRLQSIDFHRQNPIYDCNPQSSACSAQQISPDGIRYVVDNYGEVTHLRINNIQSFDYGAYRCSAVAFDHHTGNNVLVYQTTELLP